LEEIGTYYPASLNTVEHLKRLWTAKGNYWETAERLYKERARMEGNG
jgi:hypothetical protein